MTEREKEYVCDHLCKYVYLFDGGGLELICEKCLLNMTRGQKRKEYMQQYYKNKIKPARKKSQNREGETK